MQLQHTKWFLRVAGVGLYLAAAMALTWSLLWPITLPPTGSAGRTPTDKRIADAARPNTAASSFWRKRLRVPLFDPPVAADAGPIQPESNSELMPSLNAALLGTILEPGHDVAILAMPPSSVVVKSVGEKLNDEPDGAELVEIARDKVVLRHRGELITVLTKPANVVSNSVVLPQDATETVTAEDPNGKNGNNGKDEPNQAPPNEAAKGDSAAVNN